MTASAWRGLAALALLASTALGRGDVTQVLSETRVQVHAWSPWPHAIHKGWVPMFVEATNLGSRRRNVELVARGSDWSVQRECRQKVLLEPGESVRVELLCPVAGSWQHDYMLEVRADGENGYLNGPCGGGGASEETRAILSIGPDELVAGTIERWVAEISTVHTGHTSHTGKPPATPPNDNLQFGHATFDDLPASLSAYTSLDLVVLDCDVALPPAQQLDPLLAWVRGGGSLIVAGPDASARCAEREGIAGWMEPRFAIAAQGDARVQRCGLGRLAVLDVGGYLEAPEARSLVRALADDLTGVIPDPDQSRTNDVAPSIPGLGEIPYPVFAALLVIFALLVGPVNFIIVARWRKPTMLLITIPCIALFAMIVLISYGVIFQGLDVKTASASVALLDQRSHRSSCVEKRLLFAGLAPSNALRPEPGTSVHVITEIPAGVSRFGRRDRYRLEIDRAPEMLLKSDYLPTRITTMQVLCTERAERRRLDVAREGSRLRVTNNLGVELKSLVVRDPDGDYHGVQSPLGAGQSSLLEPLDPQRGAQLGVELLTQPFEAAPSRDTFSEMQRLPPACYAAALETSPFRDACGIETNERWGSHALLGVLALDEEAWR